MYIAREMDIKFVDSKLSNLLYNMIKYVLLKLNIVAREMVQWLRAQTDLTEDQNLLLRTHIW